jgi:hypothetical protein
MTPDEIAKRHAFSRSGYELIGYAEVGLPIYQITLFAYTITHKSISPLDEFTLKSIAAGLTSVDDLGSFLGLKPNIVRGILSGLIMSEDISLSGTPGNVHQALRLTQKGTHTVEEAEVCIPEERTFQIHFDGLLRRPFLLNEVLFAPREIREYGWLEIPSIPSTRPRLKDLRIQDVEQIIKQIGRRAEESKRDILSIKNIESGKLLYRHAVLLQYRSKNSDSTQTAFTIDGRMIDEYERAFAIGGGPERIRLPMNERAEIEDFAKEVERQTGRSLPSVQQTRLKEEEAMAAENVAKAQEHVARAGTPDELRQADAELSEATNRLKASEAALAKLPVRSLSVYEHPPSCKRR